MLLHKKDTGNESECVSILYLLIYVVTMRYLSLLILFCFSLMACDNSVDQGKSTNTSSSEFSTLESKRIFLKEYLKPKSSFQKLDFLIHYRDNSQGFVPGPSDWDIRLLAIVPPNEIDQWVATYKILLQEPTLTWLSEIPSDIDYSEINEWFDMGFSSVVGIHRELGILAYRNVTN